MLANRKTSFKKLKEELSREYLYLKSIFTMVPIPLQMKGQNVEELVDVRKVQNINNVQITNRARSIGELEEKLEKIKSEKKFSLKKKYMKKSLLSKLSKKSKKLERTSKDSKQRRDIESSFNHKVNKCEKVNTSASKPVFNNDGKLVFSKFDFTGFGENNDKSKKLEKDPKKALINLQKQEQKVQQLQDAGEIEKVSELKNKIAWKNVLKKAEGDKVKDDAILLKKTVKKMEQKKKHSTKQWDSRLKNVQQKMEERQKKRQENIAKKKKEKKTKKMKNAAKRGRIII
ncbi:Surfeit locus protein 6 homolog [Eumeta japonica]|uniref:Surfeit locus protein 6 homolog n=1 Tax=Eumeta variegata TaxID=151549 RepID=A0A4C1WXA1_EUMVA|nr:Surfeit locus protein 6 homolog [Eumeta japonica]